MKSLTILGGVGKDPEQRTTQSGKSLVSLSIAVDDGWGDNKRTLWFDCTIWGARGEAVLSHVKKGDKLCVTGDLSTREYNDKTYLTVNVSDFSFAGKGKSESREQHGGEHHSGQRPPSQGSALEDEIPFNLEARA